MDVLTDGFPEIVKNACGTGKVNSCKIFRIQYRISNHCGISVNYVDNTIRQSGFFKYFYNHICRKDLSCRRLPYHYRSEEHTSELQSRENLVCRLLLEKKK